MAHTPKPQRRRKKRFVRAAIRSGQSRWAAERTAFYANIRAEGAREMKRLGTVAMRIAPAFHGFTTALRQAIQAMRTIGDTSRGFRPGGILPTQDQETP